MAELTRAGIVRSAAMAMLAQARLVPEQVLSLLLPAARSDPGLSS